jgi:hypothetical protein
MTQDNDKGYIRKALAKSKSDVLEPISKMRSILKLAQGTRYEQYD